MATAPILHTNELQLIGSIKADPTKALRTLRQRWDSLMTLAAPDDRQKLGLAAPYSAFSTFYTGALTVPASYSELKAGQLNELLSSHVSQYYKFKREHLKYTKRAVPAPAPTPVPAPQEQLNFMPLVVGGILVGGLMFLARRVE